MRSGVSIDVEAGPLQALRGHKIDCRLAYTQQRFIQSSSLSFLY